MEITEGERSLGLRGRRKVVSQGDLKDHMHTRRFLKVSLIWHVNDVSLGIVIYK